MKFLRALAPWILLSGVLTACSGDRAACKRGPDDEPTYVACNKECARGDEPSCARPRLIKLKKGYR